MEQERYYDALDRQIIEAFNKEAERVYNEERNKKIEQIKRTAPLDPKIINMKSDLMITDFLTGRI